MNIASGRLLFAAEQNHTADALAYIESGADINAQNEFGQSSLLIAARNANLTLVQGILPRDPDLETADAKGRNALLWAARGKHTDTIRLLLEYGAQIDTPDNWGATALFHQMRDPDPTFVAFLLKNGASPNRAAERGETPLFAAVQKGRIDIVRQLLEYGAALDPRDWRGETPLDYALRNRMDLVAHTLIELGATASRPLLEWLGYTSETINSPDDRDWTPLAKAVRDGEVGRMHLLLDAGADGNTRDKRGTTPLMIAAQGYADGVLEALLAHGCDPEIRDYDGATALHHAVQGQRTARVQALLDRNVNLYAYDNQGRSPRILAQKLGLYGSAAALLHAERERPPSLPANLRQTPKYPDSASYAETDLLIAVQIGDEDRVLRCLSAKDPVDAREPSGCTALMVAAAAGHLRILNLLLAHGANPFARDDNARTALDYARNNSQDTVVEPLEDAMGITRTDPRTTAPEGFW